ncbi:MFS transporter [Cellulomonas sp. zg-ZUI222]|uniref:MFS transporter n=1 Tax=Cellulomonas wangleii TaxID=2816956 RepID=A0ABX8D8B6_9CELL|nr:MULTISPECIES: MFS transporter [Cellulomonas]MBO0899040.1 MFS transporter [Cellulomonas sp. zg-ZUI22]MBO0919894.1 MFS transporter [Cellulomonas wangleii]MBO0923677.1 MFS transporter [Cellulomonas wangleii]QVI61992.1 MFS transporter [Cellulomonas wangleii]
MLQTYRDVLARPGAFAFSATGIVARLPMSMVGIGIVLMVSALYGSYGLAGRVSAAVVIAQAVGGPQLARLVDRHGQARVMRPAILVSATSIVALVVAASMRAPSVWLYVTAVLAGATIGSFGSLVRARWNHLLGDDPRRVHTAYSLESALDELVFVIGPVAATALATSVSPVAGLVVPVVAMVVGGLAFLSLRDTEPPTAPAHEPRVRGSVLQRPGVVVIVLVFVAIGAIFGATDVATVAFAEESGRKSLAGVILAVFALGSLISGLLYGARHWVSPLYRRFAIGVVALAVGVCAFFLAESLWVLAAVMFVTGFAIAPSIINGNALVAALVPPGRLTEGLTWVGTGLSIGVSVGSSVAGSRIDAGGSHAGFMVVVVSGAAALVATLVALPSLRRHAARTRQHDADPADAAHARQPAAAENEPASATAGATIAACDLAAEHREDAEHDRGAGDGRAPA